MNTTEELTRDEQETEKEQKRGSGVVINVNAAGDKRVAARDYVEIHIHCGDHCPSVKMCTESEAGAAA